MNNGALTKYSVTQLFRPSTLVDLLRVHASELRGELLYTMLEPNGEESSITFDELDRRARRIAATLREHVAQGERAILIYPPGLDYIAGFLGALYAGVIAVPAYPPNPSRLEKTLPRIRAILADAQVSTVLTTSAIRSFASGLFDGAPGLESLQWFTTDDVPGGAEDAWSRPAITTDTIAFLQYTSGSTGTPKGVVLSHGNLLHNLGLIERAFRTHRGSRVVIWLPPYHDMGLIGGILQPLYTGYESFLMSPEMFIANPVRWLKTISSKRATVSGGPNFAFDLCARRIKPAEIETLDLRSWELAFCGAEPISPATLTRFSSTFTPCGFRREALLPCYGLAEATLFVTGAKSGTGFSMHRLDADALKKGRVSLASHGAKSISHGGCGFVSPEQELLIVNPDTLEPCAAREVGEIWVRGGSVARGYWKRPEETDQVFRARPRMPGQSTYLRTGDLGSILDNGELVVTGRRKDVLIVRGYNHYPQDIERTVEQSDSRLRPGRSAVFAVSTEDGEEVGVVAEVTAALAQSRDSAELEAVACAIHSAVAREHLLPIETLALVVPGSIPKTSSGKTRRSACRDKLVCGELVVLYRGGAAPTSYSSSDVQEPPSDLERDVAATFEDVLGHSRVHIDEDLFALGGNSLLAAQIGARLSEAYSIQFPVRLIFEHRSPRRVAAEVARLSESARATSRRAPSRADVKLGLASIWRQILNVEEVESHANFFQLGGTSLSAILMLTRIKEQFDVELPLETLIESATVDALADRIVAPNKREVQSVSMTETVPELGRLARTGRFPMSFSQQRLWFLDQFRAGTSAYTIPIALRLRGRLDVEALRRTFEEIVRRHEVLRTTFALDNGRPVQIVDAPAGEWRMPVRNLSLITGSGVDLAISEIAQRESQRPFDLQHGPLLRTHLIRVSSEEHILLVNMHHIISDGWSMGVLVHELAAQYTSLTAGRAATLGELPIQYADYAVWQRQALTTEWLRPHLGYWISQLSGAKVLDLPTDKPRPDSPSGRGKTHFFAIPSLTIVALERLGHANGATLFMVLLAAFQAMLHRWSGSDDISVGVPAANRMRPQIEPLIGFFVNTLVVRTDVSGSPSFVDLLARVKATTLNAFAHQEVPFERIVEALGVERSTTRAPLFQVMFALQNAPLQAPRLPGLEIEPLWLDAGTAKFDLTLSMLPWGGEMKAQLEYSTDLFEDATITRVVEQFLAVLESIASGPDKRISEAPLVHEGIRFEQRGDDNASTPAATVDFVAPQTDTQRTIAAIWREVLGTARVGIHDSFFTVGGHSLGSVLVLARINERFGVTVSVQTFFEKPTIAALAHAVDFAVDPAAANVPDVQASGRSSIVSLMEGGDAEPPLYFVHAAFGDVFCYLELARRLGKDRRVYGIRSAARGEGLSLKDLASRYVACVREAQPNGPYHFIGWSMGGLIALEMARQLEASGDVAPFVALIDSHTSVAGNELAPDELTALHYQVAGVQPWLRGDDAAGLARTVDAHIEALRTHQIAPFGGRVTLIRAKNSSASSEASADNGFGAFARGGLDIVALEGDHESLLRPPHVDGVAEALRRAMTRTR